jgi:hypothetical protein
MLVVRGGRSEQQMGGLAAGACQNLSPSGGRDIQTVLLYNHCPDSEARRFRGDGCSSQPRGLA